MRRRHNNFKLELLRKFFHVLTGVLIVLLFQGGILSIPLFGLLTLLLSAVVLYNFRAEKELLTKVLSINRADAKVPGLDVLAYFFGCWIVLAATVLLPGFTLQMAFASILVLALGDSVAHIFSVRFGATETFITRTTYLEGTIAGIIAATLAAWLYVPFIPALIAASVALIVEAGELHIADHHLDDNLVVPVVAGLVLWVISLGFPF
jgi:dolichol kinase